MEKHINSIFGKLGVPGDPGAHRRVAAVLAYLSASGPQRTDRLRRVQPPPQAWCLHDGIAAARRHD